MNIEKELEELLKKHKEEKLLEDIKKVSSFDNSNFWLFALAAMLGMVVFSTPIPTTPITNIYIDKEQKRNEPNANDDESNNGE